MYRLLMCFFLVASSASGKQNRIAGGHDAKIEHYPYMVALLHENYHNCGGSLIAKNWVLTAAHCIIFNKYSVRVGSADLDSRDSVYPVKNKYKHPKNVNLDYDFALLELEVEITLSDKVKIIKLADDGEELPVGKMLNITGWGSTNGSDWDTEVLQVVSVPVVNQTLCQYAYNTLPVVTDRMFCGGYLEVGGKDACQGDSGGPVVADGKQYGIVSWSKGCAKPENPGVYAKISDQRKWIKEIAGV